VERAAALKEVADSLAEELKNDLIKLSQLERVNIAIDQNVVRLTVPYRTLEIVCEGSNAFQLRDHLNGFQSQRVGEPPRPVRTNEPISKTDAATRVMEWLREHRVP
jgi:hypothetical protein